MRLAPVVLFVYNRPWHTQQTIEALQKNELATESELFIYSDEAKNEDAKNNVAEVRHYIENIDGFKKVTIIKREKNWGLANSIIDGVTKIVNQYGKIIVLEDDLVTAPNFLKFMNEALNKYNGEPNVYSITGYSLTNDISDIDSTYFLSITSSWSWATWADKWQVFKRDNTDLRQIINTPSLRYSFNFNDSYDYISMAHMQLEGKIDSWAIYWYLSVFKKVGLTLYPAKSLVINTGFDGSGTHCGDAKQEKQLQMFNYVLTEDIEEKQVIKDFVREFLKKTTRYSFKQQVLSQLKKLINNFLSARQKNKISILLSKFRLLFFKKKIGIHTYIDLTVKVFGWRHISVGSNTIIGEKSWLNINNRIKNFEHITIGNNCYIGKRSLISSAKQIQINDYCLLGDDCKLIGANHIYQNPMIPYAFTGAEREGEIRIGANVWMGTLVCIVGNISIGHGSIIGTGSIVTKNIPPFSIAVGNPCKVIKRYNFNQKEWIEVSKWNNDLEMLIPSEEQYLELMKEYTLDIDRLKYAANHSSANFI